MRSGLSVLDGTGRDVTGRRVPPAVEGEARVRCHAADVLVAVLCKQSS